MIINDGEDSCSVKHTCLHEIVGKTLCIHETLKIWMSNICLSLFQWHLYTEVTYFCYKCIKYISKIKFKNDSKDTTIQNTDNDYTASNVPFI